VQAWGVAPNEPQLNPRAPALPTAISILMQIDPVVVRGLRHRLTDEYRKEYHRLNRALDEATELLASVLEEHGHEASRIAATTSTEPPSPNGKVQAFPHKTAATQAGLGWIGKTALFVSADFGPAVRLATVFTDLRLPVGEPVTRSRCGACRECVDACPAGCGRDVEWLAGRPLPELLDVAGCRRQMEQPAHPGEQLCGVCLAACPLSRV
jgi:epoxyqueuosine reductase